MHASSAVIAPTATHARQPIFGADIAILLTVAFLEWWPGISLFGAEAIKNDVQPLLHGGALSIPCSLFHAALLTLAATALRTKLGGSVRALLLSLAVLIGLVGGRILFVSPASDGSVLVGSAVALLTTSLAWSRSESTRAGIALSLMFIALLANALWPLELKTFPSNFNWIPFAELVSTNRLRAVIEFVTQTLFFFAIFVFVERMRGELVAIGWVVALVVLALQWVQLYVEGRSGSITPVSLVLLAAALVRLFRSKRQALRRGDGPVAIDGSTVRTDTRIARSTRDYRLHLTIAVGIYVAVIVYGTLFSSNAWRVPDEAHFLVWEARPSRADMLENILGYFPLGVLLAARLRFSLPGIVTVLVAAVMGALLSVSLELTQVLVPGRQSSAMDLIMNIAGTSFGAIAGVLFAPRQPLFESVTHVRNAWFIPGLVGDLGAAVALLWIASQISPFIPTLDVATVRSGLSAAWQMMRNGGPLNLSRALMYACYLSALGLALSSATRSWRVAFPSYCVLVLTVLLMKPFFLGRELSLEALSGFAASLPLIAIQKAWPLRVRALIGVSLLCVGFFAYEFMPSVGPFHPFNWVPFRGEITNTLNGIMGLTELTWVFFSIGALSRIGATPYTPVRYAFLGGGALSALVAYCEWSQQFIPGRYGDVTTIGIAIAGWSVAWLWSSPVNVDTSPMRKTRVAGRNLPHQAV